MDCHFENGDMIFWNGYFEIDSIECINLNFQMKWMSKTNDNLEIAVSKWSFWNRVFGMAIQTAPNIIGERETSYQTWRWWMLQGHKSIIFLRVNPKITLLFLLNTMFNSLFL